MSTARHGRGVDESGVSTATSDLGASNIDIDGGDTATESECNTNGNSPDLGSDGGGGAIKPAGKCVHLCLCLAWHVCMCAKRHQEKQR